MVDALGWSVCTVSRRVAEKGSLGFVVCCIHGGAAWLWAHSKGSGKNVGCRISDCHRRCSERTERGDRQEKVVIVGSEGGLFDPNAYLFS